MTHQSKAKQKQTHQESSPQKEKQRIELSKATQKKPRSFLFQGKSELIDKVIPEDQR